MNASDQFILHNSISGHTTIPATPQRYTSFRSFLWSTKSSGAELVPGVSWWNFSVRSIMPQYSEENERSNSSVRLFVIIGALEESPEHFPAFFEQVLRLCLQESDLKLKRYLVVFMINCFQSLENPLIRSECMRYEQRTITMLFIPMICSFPVYLSTSSIQMTLDLCHFQRGTHWFRQQSGK